MSEIYNLLSKHFLKETSQEEELLIEEYKRENETEYQFLSLLWERGNVSVKDFDSKQALTKVNQLKKQKAPVKRIGHYKTVKRIISVAAVFLVGLVTVYYTNFYNPIVTETNTSGSSQELLLSDGSTIWLNTNSSVSFPKHFDKHSRTIELKGEAFFEVTKNPQQPFIVNTSNSSTKVLGTSFNIKSSETLTTVSVATGKVQVSDESLTHSVIILPGFSADVSEDSVNKYETSNVNFLSWKTKLLEFDNASLAEVKATLEHYFNLTMTIEGESATCRFTGKFENSSLEEIISVMEYTFDMDYSNTTENTYNLTIKNCN